MNLAWAIALAPPLLALHMLAVALTRALRAYSRSRLEEVCAARGRPGRADEVAHRGERAELAAEGLAVLTGLGLAALLGALAARNAPRLASEAVAAIALALGALGHVAAGVAGRVYAEVLLDALWPLADVIRRAMTPLTFALRQIEALAYRRSRRTSPGPRPPSVEVELHEALDVPPEDLEADLPESIRAIFEGAVALAHRDVAELMVPRSAMVVLPASANAREAAEAFARTGFSRVPVFGAHRDDIVGVLYAKDLLAPLAGEADPGAIAVRKLARAPFLVPETKSAAELLEEFRARRLHLAIVVDEYGAVAGLVTLEDLLESVVGPIDDEHDKPTPTDQVVPLGDSRFEVDAALEPAELNERLGLHLPTDGDFETVGGFAFNALGHLPEPGASFRHEGVAYTVTEVAGQSIRRLRLDLNPPVAVEQDVA